MLQFYEYVLIAFGVCALSAVVYAVGMGHGFVKGVQHIILHPELVKEAMESIDRRETHWEFLRRRRGERE